LVGPEYEAQVCARRVVEAVARPFDLNGEHPELYKGMQSEMVWKSGLWRDANAWSTGRVIVKRRCEKCDLAPILTLKMCKMEGLAFR
jgi:hypothetical protein